MAFIRTNGSTDNMEYFVLRDASTGLPKTDVTVTDIDIYYLEQGAAMAAKVDATALAAADTAHTDNYAYNVGLGLYRVDFPDAAYDGGVGKQVYLILVHASCITEIKEVVLTSATRGLAGTALPDAASGAAGGLPVSAAGSLAMDTLADWVNGGRLDLLLDAVKAKTDSLTFTVSGDVDVNVQTWAGTAVATPTTGGVPEVDVTYVRGLAVPANPFVT